jgi:hypothetical protein
MTTSLPSHSTTTSLQCEIGPLKKTYGKTSWLVYSCSDKTTLVIVSAPGNPAMPFYFSYHWKQGAYLLTGEGLGNQQFTSAALNELEKLSMAEIKQ